MIDKLQSYSSFIFEVAKYEHRIDSNFEQFKATALLIDGSKLHINEVWIDKELHKYSYYWLDFNGKIIQGWDNAPHHPHIATHPHHTHIGDEIATSNLRSLQDLLEILDRRVSDKAPTNSEIDSPG